MPKPTTPAPAVKPAPRGPVPLFLKYFPAIKKSEEVDAVEVIVGALEKLPASARARVVRGIANFYNSNL